MKDTLPYGIFTTFIIRIPLFPFNYFSSLIVDESLFLESSEFYELLQKWINGNEVDLKESERFFQTIYKYLSRMYSRYTPFSLFAGCGVGRIGNETLVRLCNAS